MVNRVGRPKGSPRPPGSGRRKGTPNKATAEVKSLAQQHGADVIKELARLALNADQDGDRIAAGRTLLERGYGKAANPINIGGFDGGPITKDFWDNISREGLDSMIARLSAIIGPEKPGGG